MSEKPSVPQPREGRCQYYMARKQRYCTVILDGKALTEGWGYCHDHKVLVDAAGGAAPSPSDACRKEGKSKRIRTTTGEQDEPMVSPVPQTSESVSDKAAGEDERVPCPYGKLHTIRKANYWQHLKICPHRPSPSVAHCTRVDCNIFDPSVRRTAGAKRPLFTEFDKEQQGAFLAWVEDRYVSLAVESTITMIPLSTEDTSVSHPFSVANYVRPSLRSYVTNGKEKEARQHVALANIVDLAFFDQQVATKELFDVKVAKTDALLRRYEAVKSSPIAALPCIKSVAKEEPPTEEGGKKRVVVCVDSAIGGQGTCFVEYGAGKGGLVAAMRTSWPLASTIVVDRDMFRDMKDASLLKNGAIGGDTTKRGGKREHGVQAQEESGEEVANGLGELDVEEVARSFSQYSALAVPHTRLKMDCKDFDLDQCLNGIRGGQVETTLSSSVTASSPKRLRSDAPPELRPAAAECAALEVSFCLDGLADHTKTPASQRCIAIGKHLCGGCTDMALRSVVESKEAAIGGVLIATCCHHMCSCDTYVFPELFLEGGAGDALSYQQLMDCCCGTAGWGISGSAIDDERRRFGRMVKRLLDYGRVQYLKRAKRGDGAPLFSFVGMVRYINASITEENEVLVAIP